MSTQTYGCIGLEFPILLDRRVVEQHKGWPINIVLNRKPGKVSTVWCSGKEVGEFCSYDALETFSNEFVIFLYFCI